MHCMYCGENPDFGIGCYACMDLESSEDVAGRIAEEVGEIASLRADRKEY